MSWLPSLYKAQIGKKGIIFAKTLACSTILEETIATGFSARLQREAAVYRGLVWEEFAVADRREFSDLILITAPRSGW